MPKVSRRRNHKADLAARTRRNTSSLKTYHDPSVIVSAEDRLKSVKERDTYLTYKKELFMPRKNNAVQVTGRQAWKGELDDEMLVDVFTDVEYIQTMREGSLEFVEGDDWIGTELDTDTVNVANRIRKVAKDHGFVISASGAGKVEFDPDEPRIVAVSITGTL